MTLSFSGIRNDSISFLRSSFPNHVQVFSLEISPVFGLNFPYIFSSSHLCFLVFVVVLFALKLTRLLWYPVIRLPKLFLMYLSSSCIEASTLTSMQVNSLSSSFFETCNLSMSPLRRKALCIVIIFLVLWSIFWVLPLSILRMAMGIVPLHTKRTVVTIRFANGHL